MKRYITAICLVAFFIHCSYGQSLVSVLNKPLSWYKTKDAIEVAKHIVLFQRNAGGWAKSNSYFGELTMEDKLRISNDKYKRDCTFDNDATYLELRFLARVCTATDNQIYLNAFNRGLDFIFEAQYENGGWPQYYPESDKIWSRANSRWCPQGIEHFITYNDDAMIGIMTLLKEIVDGKAYNFLDPVRKRKASNVLEAGLNCIFKSQFYYDGRKTAWPAQIDEFTFEPKWGRNFEPPSIASRETAGILRFLLSFENPGPEMIDAIQSSVIWLNEVKITNKKIVRGEPQTVIEEGTGIVHKDRKDMYLKESLGASPIWARFYELNTFKPVFCSRNDTVKYTLDEISLERRSGYDWYGSWSLDLINNKYSEWCKKNKEQNLID